MGNFESMLAADWFIIGLESIRSNNLKMVLEETRSNT